MTISLIILLKLELMIRVIKMTTLNYFAENMETALAASPAFQRKNGLIKIL